MRVAYVCADPGVPVFGSKGASIHVQEVLRALGRRGARLDLFATRLGGAAPPGLEQVSHHDLPAPAGDGAARERAALAANDALRAALEREGPFDLVYERHALWSFAAMEHARDAGVPGLLEVNAPLVEEQAAHRVLVDPAGAELAASRAFRAAAALLAVSGTLAAWLEARPEARGRVHVVPNGVDPDRFRPGLPPARPAPPGTFTVGFVGTLKPWHGVPVLAEAFARLHRAHPDTRLLVVGEGPERGRLESLARDLGRGVELTGPVPAGEVPGLLASMDAAVAPYPPLQDFYFSPLKMYEYMASGLPVVASRVGQVAEVLEHGVTALLCEPSDAREMTAAIERLRAEPALRARLGAAARAKVLGAHTWDHVARRALAIAGLPERVAPAARGGS